MILHRSSECIGYAELEQAWKYMTIRCISFHPGNKFDHVIKKWSRSTQCHHLNKFGSYLSTQCCLPSFKVIGLLVLKKDIFEGFYHIWA